MHKCVPKNRWKVCENFSKEGGWKKGCLKYSTNKIKEMDFIKNPIKILKQNSKKKVVIKL